MLKIPKSIFDQMLDHAERDAPFECCGLLAGKDAQVTRAYKIANIVAMEGAELSNFDDARAAQLRLLPAEQRAAIAFVMDAREMSMALKEMRSNGTELLVVYHSHPRGPDHPSPTDIKVANDFTSTREVLNQPEPLYVIISMEERGRPTVKAYRIDRDRFIQEGLEVLVS